MTEPNITPLARRLAEENGIDWRNLEGSGPDGMIVERDILAFLAKVMAGEVELPPQPEDTQPPEELPDITEVQEALAREGVDLEELVPGITSETLPSEPVNVEEEEVLFEMNFEEELTLEEEPSPTVHEDASVADEAVEGYFAAEAPESEGSSLVADTDEELTDAEEEVAEQLDEVEPENAWQADIEPGETPEQALEELEEEFSWEAEVEKTAEEETIQAGEVEESFEESPGWQIEEEVEAEAATSDTNLEFDSEADQVVEEEEPAQEPSETFAAASASEAEEPEEETPEELLAPPTTAVFPPAFRRAVNLEALEKARTNLSEAWKKDVPPSLLLFRAVERALAELEVPMRAVLGRLDGDKVTGLMIYPADNLRALYDHYLNAEESAEGLMVIDLGETPYAEILLPESPLVTLGYAGMPEKLGLLSVSGELPTDRTRFLERIAFYLERPILLA